jgi:plasmid maintenance system killer protein
MAHAPARYRLVRRDKLCQRAAPAVEVSANWRIIFRFEDGDALDLDLLDYH